MWGSGHHYACLAPFYSPHPAVVVLPLQVDDAWLGLISRQLDWDRVELHSGIVGERGWFAEALEARPALLNRLRGTGLPLLPWGRTPEYDRLAGCAGDGVLDAVCRFESKARAAELFREVAASHPGIEAHEQQRLDSLRGLARLVTARAAKGETLVLKSEFGVGGAGTVIVPPGRVAAAGGADALVERLFAEGRLLAGDVLVEPYVQPSGRMPDVTFDAVIVGDGSVHPVGVAVMRVQEAGYLGATVGPGVLPAALADRLTRFGTDVGTRLAQHGYRGWFDIDLVRGASGQLAPVEANLRLTGPAVAFMIAARLDRVRRPGHFVRTLDQMPLGARLPEEALFEHIQRLDRLCSALGATVLPTLPSTGFEPVPTLGLAIAARSATTLDAAESLIHAANTELGAMFGELAGG